jgi:hypothetical protein
MPVFAVATGLQPALELAVVQEQHLVPGTGEDQGAGREVPLGDAAVEGIGMARKELQDPAEVHGLGLVAGDVGPEGVLETHGGDAL